MYDINDMIDTSLLKIFTRIQAHALSIVIISGFCFMTLSAIQKAEAFELSGMLTINAVNMTGENSYKTTFSAGQSLLKWPIDIKSPGINLALSNSNDSFELELGLIAEPWKENSDSMKDYDYLDESQFSGRAAHNGVDIYSESRLDSKALIYRIRSRAFPLRTRFFNAGFSAGYEYQEFDYRAYNTAQVGFGSWTDQTLSVTGPSSTYSVNYNIFSLGIAMKSSIENIMTVTLDASVLPLVTADDEDNHLRRSRLDMSSCRGSGYQLSVSTAFKTFKHWYISTECGLRRIHTSGHQNKFWYQTGMTDRNDVDIDQDTFQADIGVSYRF
jgi:hypothetical protein